MLKYYFVLVIICVLTNGFTQCELEKVEFTETLKITDKQVPWSTSNLNYKSKKIKLVTNVEEWDLMSKEHPICCYLKFDSANASFGLFYNHKAFELLSKSNELTEKGIRLATIEDYKNLFNKNNDSSFQIIDTIFNCENNSEKTLNFKSTGYYDEDWFDDNTGLAAYWCSVDKQSGVTCITNCEQKDEIIIDTWDLNRFYKAALSIRVISIDKQENNTLKSQLIGQFKNLKPFRINNKLWVFNPPSKTLYPNYKKYITGDEILYYPSTLINKKLWPNYFLKPCAEDFNNKDLSITENKILNFRSFYRNHWGIFQNAVVKNDSVWCFESSDFSTLGVYNTFTNTFSLPNKESKFPLALLLNSSNTDNSLACLVRKTYENELTNLVGRSVAFKGMNSDLIVNHNKIEAINSETNSPIISNFNLQNSTVFSIWNSILDEFKIDHENVKFNVKCDKISKIKLSESTFFENNKYLNSYYILKKYDFKYYKYSLNLNEIPTDYYTLKPKRPINFLWSAIPGVGIHQTGGFKMDHFANILILLNIINVSYFSIIPLSNNEKPNVNATLVGWFVLSGIDASFTIPLGIRNIKNAKKINAIIEQHDVKSWKY